MLPHTGLFLLWKVALQMRIRRRLKNAERIGTLFSAGLIVGESLVGVVMAFIIVFSVTNGGSDAPLALGLENWETTASWLGLAFFITGMVFFAQRVLKAGRIK